MKKITLFTTLIVALFAYSLKSYGQTLPGVFDLSSGDYSLTSWAASSPAGTYPSNMFFHRSGTQDPGLLVEMTTDYTAAYNLTTGARINGMEADGFTFVNTGTSGNIGAAVLGINTTGRTGIQVSWIGSLHTQGDNAIPRVYAIRLQYKVGAGSWTDVDGPVEYNSEGLIAGHSTAFGPTSLPTECEDQPAVYLRWKYYSVPVSGAAGTRPRLRVDDISVTSSSAGALTPPDLTADATNNNVDNNIDITFTDDATWRNAIASVRVNGTPLSGGDYAVLSGIIRLIPSNGNTLLTVAGLKNVAVEATGYTNAMVAQQIDAGDVVAGNSTATINQDLALNSTSTVTCTARDQYNNLVPGYTFKLDIQVINNNAGITEVYVVDGVNYSSTPALVNLSTATNASGVVIFDITIPAAVNQNDGIDVQVKTTNGNNVGEDFFYTPSAPIVQVIGVDPGTADVQTSSVNNVLYRASIQVINDATTLSALTATATGTYVAADIPANGFKLWYSTDATLTITDVLVAQVSSTSTGSGESLNFTGISQVFGVGTSYIFITADISESATLGNTVSASVGSDGSFTFNAGTTFSGSTYGAANLHTIIPAPVFTELVVPMYMGSKTAASTNNARTPLTICIQLDNLAPLTSYNVQAQLGLTSDPATAYGAGNVWSGAAFSGAVITNAFTTDALGSSGPCWIYLQPTGNASRFDAGMVHNLRVGFVENGGTMPVNPIFVGTKTIIALDIPITARTPETTDDGAFIKGISGAAYAGKYALLYDNEAGTGDPLFAYQARQAVPTNTTQSELPAIINDIYLQTGTSVAGDFPAIIPIGANNPNGVRRIEFRNADNTLFDAVTNATGNWGVDANTAEIIRREIMIINATSGPVLSVSPASLSGFSTNPGTASASQSFTVSGDFLTANVTVNAPVNFEVSTNDSDFFPSVVLTASGGNLVGEPVTVYVRISSTAAIGVATGNVEILSTGATTLYVALSGLVTAPEPTNHATGFTATAPSYNSITVTWLDNDGAQPADGFLILGNTTGTFTAPVDGIPQTNDTNLADGSGVMNIAHGVQTYTWAGLNPDTPYFFEIYPYTNSGATIDYKTSPAAPTATATTQAIALPLAAWTFDATPAAPATPTSIAANYGTQLTAMFYADGTNGSSLWLTPLTNPELTAFTGSTLNDPRIPTISGNAIALSNNSANGKSIILKFSMTGFENPILTFATRGTSTGFNAHQWAWSTDNVTYTDFGTNTVNTTSTFLLRTLDMGTIDALDQAADVYLRLTVSGASAATGNNRLDNIVLNATPATPSFKTLSVNVLLESLYEEGSGLMRQAQGESGPMYDPGVADKVDVKLHNATAPYASAYAYNDVDLSTSGNVTINTIPAAVTGSYYLVIKHRNSIETWSSIPVSFDGAGPVNYDFTTAASQAFGDNLLLIGSAYVIYGGDVSQDGGIDTSDMTEVDNDAANYASGYINSDVNGDGGVDTSDMTIIDNNSANYIGTIHP
jgi:hypothetical protein